ncbi:MAG: family peptidase [Flavipsychrobacter sp.]|jgi:hypothetical protein|nr:family peptidase [Flavipsychrobacter sp.]
MYKLFAFLFVALFCCCSGAFAQVDTTVKDYTSYDTVLPKDNFVDTVHHIVQDTTHHENTDALRKAREQAEIDKRWIKKQVQLLSAQGMRGRGYVRGGKDSAARYIVKRFVEFRLKPVKEGRWAQSFSFPVNTFPHRMMVSANGDSLVAGVDFLVDPASPSYQREKLNVDVIDLAKVADMFAWEKVVAKFDEDHAYLFENVDHFCKEVLNIKKREFAAMLPKGCFIIPEDGKLTWGVSRDTIKATVLYMDREIMPKNLKKITLDVQAEYVRLRNDNLIACVPGVVKDSFIVFSAHYDHLGMMGDTTYFPGASDNASGVATMLYLAKYFAKNPQRYTIVFIAFAGEEAALMGSEFFVKNPMIPLANIKFLTNIDIMGDATNGVTVVNATTFPERFELLKQLNEKGKYVPKINSRGKAANSDHYYFTEAGVPSFFIYSDGGPGYYHDVHDRAIELSLNHVVDFNKLMIDFVKEIR